MTRSSEKRLKEFIAAFDAGCVEINSQEIDRGDGTQPHPWHEEWLHLARSALQSVEGGVQGSIATKQATDETAVSVPSEAVLIEAISRALCVEAGDDPSRLSYAREMKCTGSDREPREKWEYWKPFARAAIAAYEDFIPVQGAEPASGAHVAGRTGCANRPTGAVAGIQCDDCGGSGTLMVSEAGCCQNPTRTGECCGNAIEVPVNLQCESCGGSGEIPRPSDPLTKTTGGCMADFSPDDPADLKSLLTTPSALEHPSAPNHQPHAVSQGWQDIETAPRDGTPFLCFHPDDVFSPITGIDLIWWEPGIGRWTMDGDNKVPFVGEITHWMPLPAPPSPAKTGGVE